MHVGGKRNDPAVEARLPPARDTCSMVAGDLSCCL